MYQRFYGLRELPFELTPNPKYLFLTPRHREALSNLQYGSVVGQGADRADRRSRHRERRRCCGRRSSRSAASTCSCVYLNNPALTRAGVRRDAGRAVSS